MRHGVSSERCTGTSVADSGGEKQRDGERESGMSASPYISHDIKTFKDDGFGHYRLRYIAASGVPSWL